MKKDFLGIAAELEAQIEAGQTLVPPTGDEIRKAMMDGAADFLKKRGFNADLNKAGPTTDLSADTTGKSLPGLTSDPAENAKNANTDKDSAKYVNKGKKKAAEDDDEDDDDDDDDDDMPAFFKNRKDKVAKGKKNMKKSQDDDQGDDNEMDVTEHFDQVVGDVYDMKKSFGKMEKSLDRLTKIVESISDTEAQDKLLGIMAKSLSHVTKELTDLKKSFGTDAILKAQQQVMPRIAGINFQRNEAPSLGGRAPVAVHPTTGIPKMLSVGDRDRLQKARLENKITDEEFTLAKATGDMSILQKA